MNKHLFSIGKNKLINLTKVAKMVRFVVIIKAIFTTNIDAAIVAKLKILIDTKKLILLRSILITLQVIPETFQLRKIIYKI